MVPGDVPGQLRAGLSARAVQPGGVVSPESGARSVSVTLPDPRARLCAAPVWLSRIWVLLRREGWWVNRKRLRRLYRLDGLQVRMRVRRRKHMALHRGPAPAPTGPRERWSIDSVHDALADGRPFRILTVVDQCLRSSVGSRRPTPTWTSFVWRC